MSFIYNYGRDRIVNSWLNTSAAIKTIFVNTSYVPNIDHQYLSSLTAYEVSGTNYVKGYGNSGRKAVTGRTLTVNTTTDKTYLDCDDSTYGAISVGVIGAMIYILESGGSDATSVPLICLNGTGFPKNTNGGDITFRISASGLVLLQ
jgi:hypothetical protein